MGAWTFKEMPVNYLDARFEVAVPCRCTKLPGLSRISISTAWVVGSMYMGVWTFKEMPVNSLDARIDVACCLPMYYVAWLV